MRIALTGGIACGKSLFSHFLQQCGAQILDADAIVHQLEAPGGAAVPAIRQSFGDTILNAQGGVDRKKLGALVFNDPAALATLNAILHPMVKERLEAWLAPPVTGLRIAVIPLLYEVDWAGDWDTIICLSSTEENQIARLTRQRSLSAAAARQRIAAQMPVAAKAARADIVVCNNATPAALAAEARRVYDLLMEKNNGKQ